MDHELNEELNDEIGALPESDAEILQDAEPKIILPQDRRGFLRTAALAGAGLILPRAIDSAQAAAKKPAAKPAVSKTQTAKAKNDAKSTPAQKKATVATEVKQAAQTANPPAKPVQRLNVAIIGAGSRAATCC
jgi:hypothetical protein